MTRIQTTLTILAACCAAIAAPVQAQRVADLAPRFDVTQTQTAPAANALPLAVPRDTGAALLPSTRGAMEHTEARRMSTAGHTLAGVAAGTALGMAVLFGPPQCRESDATCGIAIPFFAASGAVVGGVAGYVIGRIRN